MLTPFTPLTAVMYSRMLATTCNEPAFVKLLDPNPFRRVICGWMD